LRAVDTLKIVDRVAAEDTRRTRALLSHLGISGKPLSSLEAHASERAVERLIAEIADGQSVAFVTDAGMPGVSDPGSRLVTLARSQGIHVVVVPGPSAVTAAVAVSGLVDAPFCFVGFLPRKGKSRQAAIRRILVAREPVVLFESPARIGATLSELAAQMPDRSAVLCRELTKLHEEIAHDTLRGLASLEREWRGEITLVIARAEAELEDEIDDAALDRCIAERLASGGSVKDISTELADWSGRPRREIYARVERLKRQSEEA
jgi:16S rRNA (cytidine1402-2'-O)-methyltransferase